MSIRRWCVEISDMYKGHYKWFFFKSNAVVYIEKNKYSPIIKLHDRWLRKLIPVKVPKEYPIPIVDCNMRYTGEYLSNYKY